MRAHPYVFLLCYLRDYLQNRSPRKCSGDASDALRRCATLCVSLGSRSPGEDKLAHFARILLLLTPTLTAGCFQRHSILKTAPALSRGSFPSLLGGSLAGTQLEGPVRSSSSPGFARRALGLEARGTVRPHGFSCGHCAVRQIPATHPSGGTEALHPGAATRAPPPPGPGSRRCVRRLCALDRFRRPMQVPRAAFVLP